jgi:hypothetical protein
VSRRSFFLHHLSAWRGILTKAFVVFTLTFALTLALTGETQIVDYYIIMIFRVSTFFLLLASSLCLAWDSDEGLRGLHSHSRSGSKSEKKSRSNSEDSFDGGLDKTALDELDAAGVFDYLDRFTPIGVEVGERDNPDYQTFLQNSSATFDGYKELKYTDSLGFTKFTWDPLPNGIPFPLNPPYHYQMKRC